MKIAESGPKARINRWVRVRKDGKTPLWF